MPRKSAVEDAFFKRMEKEGKKLRPTVVKPATRGNHHRQVRAITRR